MKPVASHRAARGAFSCGAPIREYDRLVDADDNDSTQGPPRNLRRKTLGACRWGSHVGCRASPSPPPASHQGVLSETRLAAGITAGQRRDGSSF